MGKLCRWVLGGLATVEGVLPQHVRDALSKTESVLELNAADAQPFVPAKGWVEVSTVHLSEAGYKLEVVTAVRRI